MPLFNRDTGPTLTHARDKAQFKRFKGEGLGQLFDLIAPMGMYSGDANAIISPFKTKSPEMLRDIGRNASRREMFDAHNAVWTGKKWEHFTPDTMTNLTSFDKMNPATLGQLMTNAPQAIRDTPVQFTKLRPGLAGSVNKTDPNIRINTDYPVDMYSRILQHEGQHLHDAKLGNRSSGTATKLIDPKDTADLQEMLRATANDPTISYAPKNHYLHNQGEMRARLNEGLQNGGFANYMDNGLSSLFTKRQMSQDYSYHPEMIWGGE